MLILVSLVLDMDRVAIFCLSLFLTPQPAPSFKREEVTDPLLG
jgi:hypothetical protein